VQAIIIASARKKFGLRTPPFDLPKAPLSTDGQNKCLYSNATPIPFKGGKEVKKKEKTGAMKCKYLKEKEKKREGVKERPSGRAGAGGESCACPVATDRSRKNP